MSSSNDERRSGTEAHTGRVAHTQCTSDISELLVLPADEDILRIIVCVSLHSVIHATLVIAFAGRINREPEVLS